MELKRQWADSALKDLAAFAKDPYTPERLEAMGLNDRQVKAVLYVKQHGKITNVRHQEITGIKKRQASSDLGELEEKGVLERIGTTGKGTHYVLKGHTSGNTGSKGALKRQTLS